MSVMSRQNPLQLPRGRPRSFDTEAAVERAMDVFWSHGYHATALPDLLRATNLSRGSLYAAFGDSTRSFCVRLIATLPMLWRGWISSSPLAENRSMACEPTLPATLTAQAVPTVGADACWWPQPWNWLAMMLKLIVASGAFSKP